MTFAEYQATYSKFNRHPLAQKILDCLESRFGDKTMSYDKWNELFDELFNQSDPEEYDL